MKLLERYHSSARLGLALAVLIGAAGFFVMQKTPDTGITLVLVALTVYLGVPRLAWWYLWREAFRRFSEAQGLEDARALRAIFDEMREAWPKGDLAIYESVVLLEEERWGDAQEKLSTIDRRLVGDEQCAMVLNGLAWCLVETERGEDAIPLVEEAIPLAGEQLRAYCTGTLGAALVRSGRSAEGIRHLEEGLGDLKTKSAQAARAFYLGEGLRALGRADEARAAYQRAIDAASPSSYGCRAQQQLDALPTAPHR